MKRKNFCQCKGEFIDYLCACKEMEERDNLNTSPNKDYYLFATDTEVAKKNSSMENV